MRLNAVLIKFPVHNKAGLSRLQRHLQNVYQQKLFKIMFKKKNTFINIFLCLLVVTLSRNNNEKVK